MTKRHYRLIVLAVVMFLFVLESQHAQAANIMNQYPHVKNGDSILSVINNPAFKGFGQHPLPKASDSFNLNLPLSQVQSFSVMRYARYSRSWVQ